MVDGVPYMARMMGVADLTHPRFPLGRRRAGVGRDDRGARRSSSDGRGGTTLRPARPFPSWKRGTGTGEGSWSSRSGPWSPTGRLAQDRWGDRVELGATCSRSTPEAPAAGQPAVRWATASSAASSSAATSAGGAVGVHRDQGALPGVVVEQRGCLVVVDAQAVLDDLGVGVVGSALVAGGQPLPGDVVGQRQVEHDIHLAQSPPGPGCGGSRRARSRPRWRRWPGPGRPRPA